MAAESQRSSCSGFISGSKARAGPREKQIISLSTDLKPLSSEMETEEMADDGSLESRIQGSVKGERAEPHSAVQQAALSVDESPDVRGVLCTVNSPSLTKKSNRRNRKCAEAERNPTTPTGRKRNVSQTRFCTLCGKSFTRPHHLNVHMRIHTGEKPYKCTECEKCFTRSGELDVHRRVHRGEKPYSCGDCAKRFSSSTSLRDHKLAHTGTKPHACDQCEKSFTRAGDLDKHRMIHTGVRPYPCTECGMAFRRIGTLKKHQKRHTRAKSFSCVHCEKIFRFEGRLQKHQKFKCKKLKTV